MPPSRRPAACGRSRPRRDRRGRARRCRGPSAASGPRRPRASAAWIHGRTLQSWSSCVTTISSPSDQVFASAREKSYVSCVALRPKTTPRGSAPSRSATASRNASTAFSALRSLAIEVPRLDRGPVRVRAIAAPTTAGVCVPPGPSKCAIPDSRDGNSLRSAATSRLTVPALVVIRTTSSVSLHARWSVSGTRVTDEAGARRRCISRR